jgi:pimeloyl-ACP methyl ester carboxylesterase
MRLDWKSNELEVREAGEGPSIVLLHGYPLDGAMWSSVARRLSDRFRVLKPDLPGHGENPAPSDGSIGDYADFIEALVAAAGTPVGMAGFSMGGYVCLALMRRRPSSIRALALVDTRARADDPATKQARDQSIATLRSQGVGPIADGMLLKLLSPEAANKKDLVERVRRVILRQKADTLASDLAAMRDRHDSTDLLPLLDLPTLVLAGGADAISPPEEGRAMAAAIPAGRFAEIPGAGHLTPMESPSAVARALGDFFEETLRS